MRKITKDEFISRSNTIHGNKYNYENINYINTQTKILINCKLHGNFEQLPNAHLRGQGCPKCNGGIRYNLQDFKEKSNKVHNNKYDYSKSIYISSNTPIDIICKIHGKFKQLPNNHISGQGCPKCNGKSLNKNEIIEKLNNIHNNKYDYSLSIFKGSQNNIKIICQSHGVFKQKLSNHLNLKQGCPICAGVKNSNTKEFIRKSIKIHGTLYDYKKVEYKNAKTNVKIRCKKHGEFQQQPSKHLSGQGCPICKLSKGELKIVKILEKYDIKYQSQKKFSDISLVFDFYISEKNTCIEFDGIQHFKPINHFGGKKAFEEQKIRDNKKDEYCLRNNIHLLRIPYYVDDIESIIIDHLH